MYYKGLSWKSKLLLMSSYLWIGPLVLFSFYKQNGHLPRCIIIGIIIAPIFFYLLIYLGDRSYRKYYTIEEVKHEKNDQQRGVNW